MSATDSLRRQYRQQQKAQKKKTKTKHKTIDKNETKNSIIDKNKTRNGKGQKLSRVNPEIGFRLMRNGGGVFSMISEEDLTQDPSCCLSDNCSTTNYQNHAGKLPEIVISNATGCSGGGGGVPLRSGGGGGSDGVTTATAATSAPPLCYVKLNSSPLIRRHDRPHLVAISNRPTGGSSGHTTADTTTTSDSLDLFSSTEYDNASCTKSTLLLVNNDEMTKCFDQSSPEEDGSSHDDMPVLQESASLTSLVLQNSSRPIATNSVNNFVSKGFQNPYGLEIHDNQEKEAADNRSDKTRNMEREARNSLVEIRTGAAGLHLSAQVSSTAVDGDAADLAASDSDQSRGESAIKHKSIKYSAGKDNPIKQMTADDHSRVKPETDSGLSSSGDNLAREVNKKFNGSQMDHNQLASTYEAPDSVEPSRSSDIALDARRTCLKTMATTTTAVDEYTGSSEATSNKHKINHVNDVSKNRAHRAKITKRRHRAQTRNKIIVSQEKRAAKTLGIIMGCFVVCWLPFFIVAVLRPFYAVPPVVTEIITWLGYFNSLINPGIYTFFNQDFRRAFYKIVTFRMCRQDSLYI